MVENVHGERIDHVSHQHMVLDKLQQVYYSLRALHVTASDLAQTTDCDHTLLADHIGLAMEYARVARNRAAGDIPVHNYPYGCQE